MLIVFHPTIHYAQDTIRNSTKPKNIVSTNTTLLSILNFNISYDRIFLGKNIFELTVGYHTALLDNRMQGNVLTDMFRVSNEAHYHISTLYEGYYIRSAYKRMQGSKFYLGALIEYKYKFYNNKEIAIHRSGSREGYYTYKVSSVSNVICVSPQAGWIFIVNKHIYFEIFSSIGFKTAYYKDTPYRMPDNYCGEYSSGIDYGTLTSRKNGLWFNLGFKFGFGL